MKLRKHQVEALAIASKYASREWSFDGRKFVTAYVTPGGGKTGMSHGYANALVAAGLIDRVVIIAPRKSLVTQTIDAWETSRFGEPRRLVNVTGASLAEGYYASEFGAVTTYQAIAKEGAAENYRSLVSGARTLLILDEPHHLSAGGTGGEAAWLDVVAPMAEAARHVLLMSGTMARHDGQRIPFATYDGNGSIITDIAYTRRQALDEHAVLPIDVTHVPANVIYGKGDREFSVSLSEATATEAAPALRTALELSSYRDEKILDFLREHALYQKAQPGSAAIVVVHAQKVARQVAALARRVLGIDVALAISDDDGAQGAIAAFRKGYGPKVLVTVGMAYEGLDAPHATHMALFHTTRSEPWNWQAIARITRYNPDFGAWETQRAQLTAPDDPPMCRIIDNMIAEEKPAHVPDITARDTPTARAEDRRPAEATVPIDASPLTERYSDDEGAIAEDVYADWFRKVCVHQRPLGRGRRHAAEVVRVLRLLGVAPGATGLRLRAVHQRETWRRNQAEIVRRGAVPIDVAARRGALYAILDQVIAFATHVVDGNRGYVVRSGEKVFLQQAEKYRRSLLDVGVPLEDLGTIVAPEAAE